ncbi:MAG: purine/pyrimidine permease [Bacteroidetes bacterium]|nr:purine/pyrimidine permease [Bacteroidota bacterium]
MDTLPSDPEILYQPDESPPLFLNLGLALQMVMLSIGGIVLTPAIIIRAADASTEYLVWAVFAAVVVSGISTIIQALGKFRIGAGHILLMGTSGAFIGVCIGAIVEGGPAVMATLVIISSLIQIIFARSLSKFRHILTPTVTGTVIMLIAVTVMPILFDMILEIPEEFPLSSAAVSATSTLVITLILTIKAKNILRLWAPMIGVISGTIISAFYGLYDTQAIIDADWIGLPTGGFPGIDLSFSPVFWAFLPAFVFVTIIGAIETVGDSIAIQKVSWRNRRAPDFRTVQGALSADGIGNFLSGMFGTIPNTTYSTTVSIVELTGVASKSCGIAIGGIIIFLSINPKFLAVILAIPSPVVGAFLIVLVAMLFILGMKIVLQDGLNYKTGLICGISFWVGVGIQNGDIFPGFFNEFAAGAFKNGMVSGGLIAIALTLISDFSFRGRQRIQTKLDISVFDELRGFIDNFSKKFSWSGDFTLRVEAAVEEALLILCDESKEDNKEGALQLSIKNEPSQATLEFYAGDSKENLEDRIALLGTDISTPDIERDFSVRMLKHLTTSVRHERYHGTEILILKVQKSSASDVRI